MGPLPDTTRGHGEFEDWTSRKRMSQSQTPGMKRDLLGFK